MDLPLFYAEGLNENEPLQELDENSSRHALQVLRMRTGDELQLTNGYGKLCRAVIAETHRRKCMVSVQQVTELPRPAYPAIGISLLKNASRFEWFLEKATEIGVSAIIPLKCQRTERTHFRTDRMKGIMISAMLQSQQAWLPEISDPVSLADLLGRARESYMHKWIAHCGAAARHSLPGAGAWLEESRIMLIGPEGDFTPEEIGQAESQDFIGVSLGANRLRTETAALTAVVWLSRR